MGEYVMGVDHGAGDDRGAVTVWLRSAVEAYTTADEALVPALVPYIDEPPDPGVWARMEARLEAQRRPPAAGVVAWALMGWVAPWRLSSDGQCVARWER